MHTIRGFSALAMTVATALFSSSANAAEEPTREHPRTPFLTAGAEHCTATPNNPHRSKGSKTGRIVFKTRVTCKGTYPSVTVHIAGVLQEGPNVGPKTIAARSSQTQVVKTGTPKTFHTPLTDAEKQVHKAGRYQGGITGEITAPKPGNIGHGHSQWVMIK